MRIGILGAGQLGMMLGQAAASQQIQELAELECIFYDQASDPCAAKVGKVYQDLQQFIHAADLFTYEFENIPPQVIRQLPADKILSPPAAALHIAADRYQEKSYFAKLGIGTAAWLPLNCDKDLFAAARQLGLPLLVKSTRMGYDGKGQRRLADEQQLQQAAKDLAASFAASPASAPASNTAANAPASPSASLDSSASAASPSASLASSTAASPANTSAAGSSAAPAANSAPKQTGECPFIAEQLVNFQRELSLLAARDARGNLVHYPVVENVHKSGILYSSTAPANIDPATQQQCQEWMEELLCSLSYVGLLTLELFDTGDALLANEMAPRVHNSGHWTIEGAATSQFANHIRAIAGLPLGATAASGYSRMYNLVGSTQSVPEEAKNNGKIHIYGKAERPGRKLGHITFKAATAAELDAACSCMHKHRNFLL